jgi:rhodanese-related sulfurtransferase
VKFSEFNPNNPENGKVLDVRKRSEWDETGHFKNARHIAHTRLLDRYEELDLNTRYYVHCEASGRASVATALLAKKGYNVVLIHDDIKQIDPSLLTKD